MTGPDQRAPRGLVPLVVVSAVVVLVVWGLSRGLWLDNLHNGLLALALTSVGAYVLFQRPRHREGLLFMAAGAVEAVMFLGRQIGHGSTSDAARWWGWVGVWPLALALGLTTVVVVCFPDGRLPSPRWRGVIVAVVAVTGALSVVSALWPVDYADVGVTTEHPFHAVAPAVVRGLWAGAHPAYAVLQVLWVVALVDRWRSSDGHVRRQLAWVLAAASVSVVLLAAGLVGWGTPVPGLISAAALPVVAGWAIVHGQHVAAYAALSWLSHAGVTSLDLPDDLARTVAQALDAPGGVLWMGPSDDLRAVGVWPPSDDDLPATTLDALQDAAATQARAVTGRGGVVGALSIHRARDDGLSLAQDRLLADLAAQAALLIEHLDLSELIARERRAGHLGNLTPRERDVLELMARGLSNTAICEELHLSVKTVEPVVSTIFTKLGLHADASSNRRVLAVLAFVRTSPPA